MGVHQAAFDGMPDMPLHASFMRSA
jgi:hypothetical protein